jgi:cell wall-associated NlpC family hydrolase
MSLPSRRWKLRRMRPVKSGIQKLIADALDLVGIRYRRGGNDAETGFDCSGFVGYVFRERLGWIAAHLTRYQPRRRAGGKIRAEPGDLVFFNTMRRAFSHVGIYLGDNRSSIRRVRAIAVRVEDMRDRYWTKRYNGAGVDGRRAELSDNAQEASGGQRRSLRERRATGRQRDQCATGASVRI